MASIKQNAYSSALPDFRNMGIVLRVLLGANLFAVAAAVLQARDARAYWEHIVAIGALVEPLLIFSAIVLVALNDLLRRLPYWAGAVAVLVLELALTTGLYAAGYNLLDGEPAPLWRYWVLVALTTLA